MHLRLECCDVRSWRPSDAEAVARYANNRAIWLNLRDAFPHPYTRKDAERFIAAALEARPETRFAICAGEEAVGSIGFMLHPDVERITAEIGYWLGEPFWGRGIMAEALAAVTRHAILEHGLTRVYAVPYESNPASFRVLQKAGYVLEGRMRKSCIKDGRILDQLLYAFVVE
jgi:[ribosomal protein S5]-alanine N-acetyltransferase